MIGGTGGWGGGGGGKYSYIPVLPDEFLFKSVVFKLISKEISRAEHEYMNKQPPNLRSSYATVCLVRRGRENFRHLACYCMWINKTDGMFTSLRRTREKSQGNVRLLTKQMMKDFPSDKLGCNIVVNII